MGCTNTFEDCKKALEKLDAMLDGELSQKEENEVIDHLKKCNECDGHFESEKSFRDYLRKTLARKSVNVNLISNIKAAVFNSTSV